MDICSIITPFVNLFQQALNSFFGLFSFLGIQTPDIAGLLLPWFGCAA